MVFSNIVLLVVHAQMSVMLEPSGETILEQRMLCAAQHATGPQLWDILMTDFHPQFYLTLVYVLIMASIPNSSQLCRRLGCKVGRSILGLSKGCGHTTDEL